MFKKTKLDSGNYEYRGFGIVDNNVSRTTGNVSAMRRWAIKDSNKWSANTIGNAPTLKAAIKDIDDRFDRYSALREV
jgi:hypothetical protein